MATERTGNFKLPLPALGRTPWRGDYIETVKALDALLARFTAVSNYQGVWRNSIRYTVGQRALDVDEETIFECLVAHTSATSPTTFSEDRAANGTYWSSVAVDESFKGKWVAGTTYSLNDFVSNDTEYKYAVCIVAHTATNSFSDDIASGFWDVLVDGSTAVTDAEAAQTAAEAAQSAAETAETNAETAETNAAASASAASTSESNAATSESNAATSESNASTSETNAASSETAAEAAQTAAEAAQTAAETAETNAEAAYDSFDDRYLGAKANDPSLDNDGDALIDGALYWNTTDNVMKVYDLGNTTWLELNPVTPASEDTLTNKTIGDVLGLTKGSDIASASPLVLGSDGSYFDVTGTTGFSQITVAAGKLFMLQFDGALTMTDGANLDLGGNDITTAAGDRALFFATAANTAQLIAYLREGTAYWDPVDTLTLGTEQASTSGTEIDFTSIPSWAKRITMNFVGVSTNGTDSIIAQVGDSGGFKTSGYLGASMLQSGSGNTLSNPTTGFGVTQSFIAAGVIHGRCVFELEDAANNVWTYTNMTGRSDAAAAYNAAGSVSLSNALDRIRITTAGGTQTFDAGAINIMYE